VPLTLLGTGTVTVRFEVHMLPSPTPGTANVVITPSASAFMTAGAFNVSGVDLDGPLRNLTFASGSGTTPSVTVPSAVGDLVVAMVLTSVAITFTPGAGQTGIWAQNGVNTHQSAGSSKAGAASVVMSSTLSGSSGWWTAGFSIPADGTVPGNSARVSKSNIDVLQQQALNPIARVTKTSIDVLQRQAVNPSARVSKTSIDVLQTQGSLNPVARVSKTSIDVLVLQAPVGGETVQVVWQ
jgi:hypothetical protein